MKYEITRTCGHIETIEVFGTNVHGERDRKVAYEESRCCRECYLAAKAAEAAEASKGLPELTGSEKQVAWAMSIRVEMLNGLKDLEARFAGQADFDAAMDALRNKTEAKFWIDNRSLTGHQVLKNIATGK